MPNPLQQIVLRLIRIAVRTLWSLLLLAMALCVGYFVGTTWGAQADEPNGMLYGLIGGLLVWTVFLRPKRGRRRRRVGSTHYDSTDPGGGWFDSAGGDDGGGGDD